MKGWIRGRCGCGCDMMKNKIASFFLCLFLRVIYSRTNSSCHLPSWHIQNRRTYLAMHADFPIHLWCPTLFSFSRTYVNGPPGWWAKYRGDARKKVRRTDKFWYFPLISSIHFYLLSHYLFTPFFCHTGDLHTVPVRSFHLHNFKSSLKQS